MRRFLRRSWLGQSTAEMAFVIPILLLVIFGTLDMGRAVYAHFTLANAAREAARKALVSANSTTTIVNTAIQAGVGLGLTSGNVTVTGSRVQAGDVVTVIIIYNFQPVTPLVTRIMGSSFQIRAFSSMVME